MLHPGANQQPANADPGDARAADDDADVAHFFADDFERIDQAAEHQNGGAVVLIGKDRDVGRFFEMVGDGECMRCGDVINADGAEGRRDRAADIDDPGGIMRVQADRKRIDPGERLEDDALAFSHWQRGFRRAAVAPKKIGAIGENGDGVAATGEIERQQWIALDFETGFGHTGGVDEREHIPVANRHFAADADQPLKAAAIIETFII
jgi:hypothetical protein